MNYEVVVGFDWYSVATSSQTTPPLCEKLELESRLMGFGGRLPVAPDLGCSLSVAMDPMARAGVDPVGSNSVPETCNLLSCMVEMGSEKWNENWVSSKIGSRGH